MDIWNSVAGFLTTRVEQLGLAFAHSSPLLIIASILVPIALAAASREWLVAAGVALLTVAVFVIDASLSPASVLVAIESYVAALLIGCIALQSARRNRKITAQLDMLRAEVDAVRRAEERRLVSELNLARPGQSGSVAATAQRNAAEAQAPA